MVEMADATYELIDCLIKEDRGRVATIIENWEDPSDQSVECGLSNLWLLHNEAPYEHTIFQTFHLMKPPPSIDFIKFLVALDENIGHNLWILLLSNSLRNNIPFEDYVMRLEPHREHLWHALTYDHVLSRAHLVAWILAKADTGKKYWGNLFIHWNDHPLGIFRARTTPLFIAIFKKYFRTANIFLQYGYDINKTLKMGGITEFADLSQYGIDPDKSYPLCHLFLLYLNTSYRYREKSEEKDKIVKYLLLRGACLDEILIDVQLSPSQAEIIQNFYGGKMGRIKG